MLEFEVCEEVVEVEVRGAVDILKWPGLVGLIVCVVLIG